MPSLVEILRNAVDPRCLLKDYEECRECGCTIHVNAMPTKRAIAHLESCYAPIRKNQTHCDYLIVYEQDGLKQNGLILLDLKGRLHIGDARNQLKASVGIAQNLLGSAAIDVFIPVAAHTGGHRHQFRRRRKSNMMLIKFGKKSIRIQLINCGSDLAEVLPKAALNPAPQREPGKPRPSRRRRRGPS